MRRRRDPFARRTYVPKVVRRVVSRRENRAMMRDLLALLACIIAGLAWTVLFAILR